jgi:signal transduction histidine kinase/CheY-like chemotaxis protein/HPt (histidine-containing phosphotransfer) domain-containing protein
MSNPIARLRRRVQRLTASLSSRTLLAFGLSTIVVCALLVSDLAGVMPDQRKAVREGRIALAETVALTASMLANAGDAQGLARYIGAVTQRNPALQGVRVRSADSRFRLDTGKPGPLNPSNESTEVRLVVPMLGAGAVWGHIEFHFQPTSWLAHHVPWLPPATPLVLFIGLTCATAFRAYLTRMLRHLDPSTTIPNRVRTAFDTLAEGLMVVDPDGRLVLANRALAEVTGLEAESLIGRSAAELPWVHGGQPRPGDTHAPLESGWIEDPDARRQRDEPVLPWMVALQDGKVHSGNVMYLTDAQGKRRTFMVNCSPIPGGSGPAGVLVSFDDVTELEEKEVELRAARDAAQDANRAKSDFLANMSHEIRTPMNAILGFTDVLRRAGPQGAADAQKYLNIIHGSGKHLLELINDILDLSKVEAGRLEVERLPCEVHQVVLDVARIMAVKAEEKGIGLRVCFDGRLPEQASTDPHRLRQVITNLVGNAIKFTAKGEVRISLRMDPAPGSTLLQIDVADSGIGIPVDRLESIFEPFVQAEASTTRNYGGTGLGLTISRRFARALGGNVYATSEPGKGSIFHVSIDAGPLDGAAWLSAQELEARREQGAAAAGEQVTWVFPRRLVLVVDDGRENRELLRVVLGDAGLEMVEAENGAIGLERAAEHDPDLILMDIQMPVMDGITATKTLRQRGFVKPVIALTANAMKGFEREIEEGGFTCHMTKPVDIDALLARLAQLLGGRKLEGAEAAAAQQAAAQPAPAASSGARPAAGASGAPITSRLASHPRLAKVAARFCTELPGRLQEMRSELEAGAHDRLAALAHWLKGAGGSVGYDAFFEPARELELGAKAGDAAACAACLQTLDALAGRIVPPHAGAGEGGEAVPASGPQAASEAARQADAVLERARAAAASSGASQPSAARSSRESGQEPIRSRLAGHPKLAKVAANFCAQLPGKLSEMEAALAAGVHAELASLAHWLKGAGGSVGFDALFEPARELELAAKSGDVAQARASLAELRALSARLVAPEAAQAAPERV